MTVGAAVTTNAQQELPGRAMPHVMRRAATTRERRAGEGSREAAVVAVDVGGGLRVAPCDGIDRAVGRTVGAHLFRVPG